MPLVHGRSKGEQRLLGEGQVAKRGLQVLQGHLVQALAVTGRRFRVHLVGNRHGADVLIDLAQLPSTVTAGRADHVHHRRTDVLVGQEAGAAKPIAEAGRLRPALV
jgi:hypothetical protein